MSNRVAKALYKMKIKDNKAGLDCKKNKDADLRLFTRNINS